MSLLSLILRPFVLFFTALDRLLVRFATPFGVHVSDPRWRYARFIGIYALIYLLGALPLPVVPLVALGVGYVGILAVGRAWVRNEKERSLIAKKLKDGKPDEMPDLRGMALASALQLFLLFPLVFQQAQRQFGFYELPENVTPWVWLGFTLDSYNKAFLNVFEVYGVRIHHVGYDSIWGRHLMVLCRVTFDFILIQGIIRLIAIRQTVADGVEAIQKDTEHVVRLGRRAVPGVIAKLNDPNPDIRNNAAKVLFEVVDKRAADPLLARLGDEKSYVRRSAIYAIGMIGDLRAVEPIIAALADEDMDVRKASADVLAHLGDRRAVEPLVRAFGLRHSMFTDPDLSLHYPTHTIKAVATFGSAAYEPLILALADHDEQVRAAAADALGQLGDCRAVDTLIPRLQDAVPQVSVFAVEALGKLRDRRATEPIIRAFGVSRNRNVVFGTAAANAFGKLKDSRAISTLIELLGETDSGLRRAAMAALVHLDRAEVVSALMPLFEDANAVTKRAASRLMKQLDPEEVYRNSDPRVDVEDGEENGPELEDESDADAMDRLTELAKEKNIDPTHLAVQLKIDLSDMPDNPTLAQVIKSAFIWKDAEEVEAHIHHMG